MPGKIKVKVLAGRNLPVMDRASDTTDAFVEIKFGGVTHKTDVCRKSLNPHWNSTEWYRFEVDESELQDEPLQLRLMDHDTYSANDAIGKVVISLAPLLAREANNAKGNAPHGGAVMSGWIPVFDTMHGIRGELNVIVKVELFSDFNKYKTSSCGVQFFHCPTIPPGYRTTSIHGFVEELVVNDDPEYQWIDKIRTPRASNEARQVAFIKLSNQVQRLVGLKAAELGANAVVGYQQDFDLEGEAGVVARAIGTAVTISPLPTPSQPMNMPPCTQQQLKKYLDILSTDNENVTDLNEYYQHHQDELAKLLTILNPKTPSLLDETDINDDNDDEKLFNNLTRQSSVKSYTGNISIYQDDYISQKSLKHISEDQTDLNRLLNRDYFDSDTPGPLRKIKKFKSNFFLKRLSSMRGRKQETQDDQISLKSNSSDTSRISLVDIKNELKKFKRIKKPKFHKIANNADEGIGMASVLARSVIHAHTSLACIAETQDSEHSPNSTLRRASESEPTINMSDEDKPKTTDTDTSFDANSNKDENKQVPEIHFSSLMNINSDENEKSERRERRFSESCPTSPVARRNNNLLKPEDADYYGSVSSALSGDSSEIYSSSDEDDESSDVRTDTEKSVETTSSIVKSVLSHEINPAFIAQMDRKLSILETENLDRRFVDEEKQKKIKTNADTYESDNTINEKKEKIVEKQHNATMFAHEDANTFVTPKSNTHHYKFHNPFTHKKVSKSFSAPSSPIENSSFVYRSSQKIKQQLSKLSNSNMIKSLSHYSLIPKKKHEEVKKMSKPNSATDILSRVPSETVLGSPFLSYADLLSLDKEEMVANKNLHKSDEFVGPKVSMYIGSEPVSRASMSGTFYTHHGSQDIRNHEHVVKVDKRSIKPSSLVHTAMETILIDKVQSLLTPSSPEPIPVTKQFFNDVSEKLEKIEEARNQTPETTGLVHTAVETMLLDKVQSLLGPTTPEPSSQKDNVKSYFDNVKPDVVELNKREQESTGLTSTAMKTMLMDKVQTLVSPKTEFQPENLLHDTDNSNKTCSRIRDVHESSGLTHTTMKTILADKVNSLLGSSKVDIVPNTQDMKSERKNGSRNKDQHSSGLVHTAMETILMDKVQSILDASSTEVNSSKEVHEISNAVIKKDIVIPHEEEVQSREKSKSLDSTKTALLVERVVEQPLFIPTSHVSQSGDDITTETKPDDTELKKKKKLIRQDTVDFVNEKQLHKMSKLANTIPRKVTTPVLQHFHPILSGAPLETIPSLPESSFDQSESIDENIPKCQCESECKCQECESSDTNNASVCDNSHAAWTVDRGERDKDRSEKDKGSPRHARHESYGGKEPVPPVSNTQNSSLHSTSTPMGIHRRSSDSDLSITPKGSSVNTPGVNVGSGGGAILKPSMNSNNLEMLEYPFLTMSEYPPGFIVHIGGTVCARSVKLVDGGGESAARAAWWAELRTELRAHARALRCNAVLAYSDTAAICEDVCVLSASGTAAVINLDCDFNADCEPITGSTNTKTVDETEECCSIAHVPYSPGAGPYRAELSVCGGCRRARVPAVVLASCAKPARLAASPRAITLTAVAARVRRTPPTGEPAARDISDQLPFLEYELHKLLIAKLRMQGANALFSLQTQVCVGERCVMALASGAAVRLAALPPPTPPRIKSSENDKDALEIQKALWDTFAANKAANGFDIGGSELSANGALPEVEGDESTAPALDLCSDKDACVLELDEAEDVETARSLATRRLHTRLPLYGAGLQARSVPPHAFTQVWRARLQLGAQGGGASAAAERHVARALDGVAYKLRRLQPCAALAPRLQLDLPEDEIQLVVSGAAIPLVDPTKPDINQTENSHMQNSNQGHSNQGGGTGDADDDIFALDEEQLVKTQQTAEVLDEKAVINAQAVQAVQPAAVVLTALNSVQGARGARRLCALRLLFVRETTCVRELGGLSGFLHTFTCEVLAIVRAYTAALGGNALTSFYITQLMLQDNAHKNQGQCLLSVGGDVVHITY